MTINQMKHMSIYTPFLFHIDISRKDDLQSLFYNFFYFLRGTLPWIEKKGLSLKDIIDEKENLIHSNFWQSIPRI